MSTGPDGAEAPVVVFVHVHYPEIWRDMALLLAARLLLPFRLVVTSSHPATTIAVPDTPWMRHMRVMAVENRGRDVMPFLRALRTEDPFDIGLKLHTKKSPQRQDGAPWRDAVLRSLLPDRGTGRAGAEAIVAAMRADGRAGLVAPTGFSLSVLPWVLVNRPGMEEVMAALGHALVDADMEDAFFAAGSMFWFRGAALRALAVPAVLDLFEPEHGQLDGTAAHAMERLFPVEAKRQGFGSMAVPALMQSRPGMDAGSLRALARCHADVPSTFFPAPYVEALPPAAGALPRTRPGTRPWTLNLREAGRWKR